MERGAPAAGGLTLPRASTGDESAPLPRPPWWRLAPTLVAAALAIVFVATDPRPVDLASHVFRAELFGDERFSIWNGQWYAGHHTPGYSVLAPALGWLLGPALMGALSVVAAAALFEQLARRHFGERARLGALWFGAGTATMLFTGRVTFALGVALALGALVLLERRRTVLATMLGLLCALASPVAALFLGLAGVALGAARLTGTAGKEGADRTGPAARGGAMRRLLGSLTRYRPPKSPVVARESGPPLLIAAVSLAPLLAFAVAFPEGGEHPFPFSSYVAIPLFGLACLALLPARERALRIGAALYVAGGTAAFVIATPLGGNSVRLGALFGGPLIACALAAHGSDETIAGRLPPRPARAVAIALVLAALAFWQVSPAVRDIEKVSGDPAAKASYYAPLNAYLARQKGPFRVEIPFTRSHWEAAEVAPEFALARGWERQLDTKQNELFYDDPLDYRSYARWLRDNGVRFVALPDATLDAHGEAEGRLVASAPPYLRLLRRLAHWRVYEVVPPPPLATNEGAARIAVERMSSDEVHLNVARPGSAIVKVRWSPYWRAPGACVERAGDWTRVDAERAGPLTLEISFAPLRALSHGRRCG